MESPQLATAWAVKQVRCSADAWQNVWKELVKYEAGTSFTESSAAKINRALGAQVLREKPGDRKLHDHRLDLDILVNHVDQVVADPDGIRTFEIKTQMPVCVELVGVPVKEGAAGIDCTFGPHKVLGDMVNMQTAYVETPGERITYNAPDVTAKIEKDQILWGQFKHRRFKNLQLVVSLDVSNVLKDALVDENLRGNDQYLLLPEARREPGKEPPSVGGTCTWGAFRDNNLDPVMMYICERFFFGDTDPEQIEVRLTSRYLRVIGEEVDDDSESVALCGRGALKKLSQGFPPSRTDIHGLQPAVARDRHGKKLTCGISSNWSEGLRKMTPTHARLHSVACAHGNRPWGEKEVPLPCAFDDQWWWEGPTSTTTVLDPGDFLLVLWDAQMQWKEEYTPCLGASKAVIDEISFFPEFAAQDEGNRATDGLANDRRNPFGAADTRATKQAFADPRDERLERNTSQARSSSSVALSNQPAYVNPSAPLLHNDIVHNVAAQAAPLAAEAAAWHLSHQQPWQYQSMGFPKYNWDCSWHQWLENVITSASECFEPAKDSRGRTLQVWCMSRKHEKRRQELQSYCLVEHHDFASFAAAIMATREKACDILVQKWLVISSGEQKIALMGALQNSAQELLYNETGCLVVSQMLQEGLDSEQVAVMASEFMAAAHNQPQAAEQHSFVLDEEKLLRGMKHKMANHAMKMWVQLLHELCRRRHLEVLSGHLTAILDVVVGNIMDLVCDVYGVRVVNGVLQMATPAWQRDRRYEHVQVQTVVENLALRAAAQDVDYLIRHQFGNHTMQHVLDFTPEPIIRAVCNNFAEYSKHGNANYVVQRSMEKCEMNQLEVFLSLFLAEKDDIMKQGMIGAEVKRTLDKTLRKKGRTDLAAQLQDGLAVGSGAKGNAAGRR